MARNINNRQKLRVTPRACSPLAALPRPTDPIARLLPRYKPQVTRNRTKYTRKGRQDHQAN
jgi:hypothetical protein